MTPESMTLLASSLGAAVPYGLALGVLLGTFSWLRP